MLLVVVIVLGDIGRTDGVEAEVVERRPVTYRWIVGGSDTAVKDESRGWIGTDGGWDAWEHLFGELERFDGRDGWRRRSVDEEHRTVRVKLVQSFDVEKQHT